MSSIVAFLQVITALLVVPLIAGWTAMWRRWLFEGDVRTWIVSLMPPSWVCNLPPSVIREKDPYDVCLFIMAESHMPKFLRKLLTCQLCATAWISGSGAILALGAMGNAWLLPLAWAAGAFMSFRIDKNTAPK